MNCLDCGGTECICSYQAAIDRLKSVLRTLYSQPLDQDSWGIKCIEDHNAIIREALAESEEEILRNDHIRLGSERGQRY